jgi:hypothetical protein
LSPISRRRSPRPRSVSQQPVSSKACSTASEPIICSSSSRSRIRPASPGGSVQQPGRIFVTASLIVASLINTSYQVAATWRHYQNGDRHLEDSEPVPILVVPLMLRQTVGGLGRSSGGTWRQGRNGLRSRDTRFRCSLLHSVRTARRWPRGVWTRRSSCETSVWSRRPTNDSATSGTPKLPSANLKAIVAQLASAGTEDNADNTRRKGKTRIGRLYQLLSGGQG